MKPLTHWMTSLTAALLVGLALAASSGPADAKNAPLVAKCLTGVLNSKVDGGLEFKEGADIDMVVSGKCTVRANFRHVFGDVNIIDGGSLIFTDDGTTHFWAKSILVEKGGSLIIGTQDAPIGAKNIDNVATIHLYGPNQGTQGQGILCNKDPIRCGVPQEIWEFNVAAKNCGADCHPGDPNNASKATKILAFPSAGYVGPVTDDYFYPYHALPFDDAKQSGNVGYFGYKVLAVSYGGTLQMFGKKGTCTKDCDLPSTTGESWVRLNKTIGPTDTGDGVAKTLHLSAPVSWRKGDKIVVTTTDYLPGHSEELTVAANVDNGTTVTVEEQVKYFHNGEKYPIPSEAVTKLGLSSFVASGAETRAAVGLLSRNIRIVSEGDAPCTPVNDVTPDTCFPADSYFGGHVVIRQGFKLVQIQGVEFKQLGQGGRLGHYPVHFHHARKTQNPLKDEDNKDLPRAPETFVKDSSINESMTRWIVLHGTQDVTLQRNVGYKSIGHGFYLEDGTKINNKLYANLGIFARAAVDNIQNPRKVPGILAAPDLHLTTVEAVPFKSDYDHPTVFWIMNGWNDFQYNMAAGAGTCGLCYWLVPGFNSTISRVVDGHGPKWESYASMQSGLGRASTTPLKSFIGNSCSTAMTSFQTIGATEACLGVGGPSGEPFPYIVPIKNDLAVKKEDPPGTANPKALDYYPGVDTGGGRFATRCGGAADDPHANCSSVPTRCGEGAAAECMVTVLDRYTTSFNWAAFNFAAIWLRPQWNLMTDSVITDVQQAGLTMVTGGGYTTSDAPTGHWALVRRSVFIGHTQAQKPLDDQHPTILLPDNRFAADGGPFNPYSGLRCGEFSNSRPGNRCVSIDEGVAVQMATFGMYQRLFSVYDGPAFQDSNAYLNVKRRTIDDCKAFYDSANNVGRCDGTIAPHAQSAWVAGFVPGLSKGYPDPNHPDDATAFCFMPNAAIGWKQPNGFYYPPAFHSSNLFFKDVDIRHFVVSPPFKEGSLDIDWGLVKRDYCIFTGTTAANPKSPHTFTGFAGNDRQTVLNDDDGSLTGFKAATVINLDPFFASPVEAIQCLSERSSRSSPYDYVTTVIYPKCRNDDTCAQVDANGDPILNSGLWNRSCTSEFCYGIPLWRQDEMPVSDKGVPRSLRMMGQNTGQRGSLTVNHGTYYFDTSVGEARQLVCNALDGKCPINVFQAGATYYLFLIFGKKDAEQVYRFYVGPTDTNTPNDPLQFMSMKLLQANITKDPPTYPAFLDFPADRVKWHDKAKGVVEVVLKTSDVIANWDKSLKDAKQAKCQPATYCTWNAGQANDPGRCEDNDSTTTPKSDATCRWAIAEPLDCPHGGCVGFSFTLPATFKTDPATDPRPPATCIVKAGSPFDVNLDARKVSDGTCPIPSDTLSPDFCQ